MPPAIAGALISVKATTMDMHEYENIIRELCGHIGIANAEDVISTQHIMLNSHPVGLETDPAGAAHSLRVVFELALTFPDRDLGLYHRLLRANLESQFPGCFGIH